MYYSCEFLIFECAYIIIVCKTHIISYKLLITAKQKECLNKNIVLLAFLMYLIVIYNDH